MNRKACRYLRNASLLCRIGAHIALLCVFLGGGWANADGIALPHRDIKQLPEIPLQRAVVRFRDGIERLIVESTFKGEGEENAWLIPVPAAPQQVVEGSRLAIEALSAIIQPDIRSFPNPVIPGFILLLTSAVFVIALLIRMTFFHHTANDYFSPLLFLFWGLSAYMAALSIAGPRLFEHACFEKTGEIPTAALLRGEVVQVGDYDVGLLQQASLESMEAWLEDNGFAAIPAEGRETVSAYLKEGWHFVAAKFRRNSAEIARPKPLDISFPCSAPVYPMRLTRLSGAGLYLELFVLADSPAQAEPLRAEYVDRFQRDQVVPRALLPYSFPGYASAESENTPVMACFTAEHFDESFGLPCVSELLWEGCVLSKLSGRLRPRQMERDIAITLNAQFAPKQIKRWTPRAAKALGIYWGAAFFYVTVLFGYSYLALRKRNERRNGRRGAAVLGMAFIGAFVVGFVCSAAAPKVEVVKTEKKLPWGSAMNLAGQWDLWRHWGSLGGKSLEEIREWFDSNNQPPSNFRLTPVDKETLSECYEVMENEQGVVLRVYDFSPSASDFAGRPYDLLFPSPLPEKAE